MADYRQIHTQFWRDEWVIELPPIKKLLFLYLISNADSNLAGVYKISLRVVEFDTGIPIETIKEIIDEFDRAGKVIYENGWIWVVNLRKHNPVGTTGFKNVLRDIQKLPPGRLRDNYLICYPEFCKYMDTLPIPYTQGISESDGTKLNLTELNGTELNESINSSGGGKNPNGAGEIFKVYEQEIGVISPAISEKLLEAEQVYERTWIIQAIKIAVNNNARNWAYCEAILRSWHEKGSMVLDKPKARASPRASPARTHEENLAMVKEAEDARKKRNDS